MPDACGRWSGFGDLHGLGLGRSSPGMTAARVRQQRQGRDSLTIRHRLLLATGIAALLALGAPPASAQTASGARGVTTGQLAELCAQGGGTDIISAASIGYCRGFLVGVGQFHAEAAGTHRSRPPIYCIPDPSPSIEQAQASFVSWVRTNPEQASEKALVGLLRWAAATFPCPQPAARANRR